MRPDRIVVGEVRGGEALDMLQAMNTGHRGSLTTAHASSAYRALLRLETMAMMAGLDLPLAAIHEQIRRGIEIVVHQERGTDGRRRIVEIAELDPDAGDGYTLRQVVP
jgi:pilus assembly protein CpaF